MFDLAKLRQKVMTLSAVAAATCFSHGSCSNDMSRFMDRPMEYVEEIFYEEEYFYEDYYYDDYYDCRSCDYDDGFGAWFDWF